MNRFLMVLLVTCSAGCYSATAEIEDGGAPSGGGGGGATAGGGGGSSGDGDDCELPAPGSCSSDSDCVIAYCVGGCNCGGAVIAASQLGESPCLVEEGTPVPEACHSVGPVCYCPERPFCTPRCTAGTCACEQSCNNGETLCNGACVDTSGDLHNCGSCGNACAVGQLCVNGVCTSSGSSTGGGGDACDAGDFCACMNFCVFTCRCGDGGCPLTQSCEGTLCPSSCPTGEACAYQGDDTFMCSPLCDPGGPDGVGGQGSCQAGMTCEGVCT